MALAAAAAAYRRGDYTAVQETCERLHLAEPARPDVLLLLGAAYYQLGDHRRSVAANDAAILIDPSCPEAHANLANALLQMGSLDLAVTYYTSAIRLKPDFADAWANLGSAHLQRGAAAEAAQAYGMALAINPGMNAVRCSLGDLWRGQGPGGRTAAQQCFTAALESDGHCAAAWRGLGDCARDAGDVSRALECYKEAVALDPASGEAQTGLGMALRELRRPGETEAAFEAAARLRPRCALAAGNLAGAYYENGKLEEAIGAYRRALELNPAFSEALNNLGNALRESGRPEEAVGCYVGCIQAQLAALAAAVGPAAASDTPGRAAPANAAAAAVLLAQSPTVSAAAAAAASRLGVSYNNLGGVLKLLGRTAECISAYEHVVMLQPDAPEGFTNLGSAYKDSGRHDEAMAAYHRSLAIRPDFPEAFANLVHSMQCVCDWRDRDALFARLEVEVRRDLAAGKLPSVQPFHAMAYPFPASLALDISRRYAEECRRVAARLAGPNAAPLAHPPATPLPPGARLRVGYVSSDFGNHPLSHLMGSVFGLQKARAGVEAFCYALSPDDGSPWRAKIASEAEHFIDVSGWTAPNIARRISADGIHILINLNGYTKGARNEVFALRPAPAAASVMGFPATMGADYIDYVLLDTAVCPPESRPCYSEAVALMPHTYFVNDYRRSNPEILKRNVGAVDGGGVEGGAAAAPTRAALGLPEDAVVYSCANQLYKHDPATFGAWCRILKRVPGSVLWLLRFPAAGEARVRAAAAAAGIDPARVIFTDVAPKPIHIARSGLADVFLDTPACNAHTTGCDVLWGGCPVITLPGERMASRVAASLCRATGLGEHMVASSLEDYEERAVALGLDGERRGALRAALCAARETCPLFDTERWVADFDRALAKMWEIHCEGSGPRDFEV